MVRVLHSVCFIVVTLCCLSLYHISEQTRVAHLKLISVEKQIVNDGAAMKVLQADWERVSEPAHIQSLAQSRLGLSDTAAASLASLDLLPRRGDAAAGTPIQTASTSVAPPDPHLHLVAAHAGN